jgi:S-adenosylmethionine uptake transporter
LIKFLGSDYSSSQIMFATGIAAVPLLAVQMALDPGQGSFRPKLPRWTVLRCAITLLNGVTGTYAFTVLPLAQCYAIFFTMPLMITLMSALFLGEAVGWGRALATACGFGGVLVALDPGGGGPLGLDHLIAFLAAMMGAASYVIVRKTGQIERPTVLVLYPTLVQLAAMAMVLPFVYVPMPMQHVAITWGMAALGIGGTFVVVAAYRAAASAVVAPMQYSQILWAALAGHFMFDEAISATTWVGLAVIILSGTYILTSARTQDAAPQAI